MHPWQIEQALITTIDKICQKLRSLEQKSEYEGAILTIVVDPDKKVGTDFKLVHKFEKDAVKTSNNY